MIVLNCNGDDPEATSKLLQLKLILGCLAG